MISLQTIELNWANLKFRVKSFRVVFLLSIPRKIDNRLPKRTLDWLVINRTVNWLLKGDCSFNWGPFIANPLPFMAALLDWQCQLGIGWPVTAQETWTSRNWICIGSSSMSFGTFSEFWWEMTSLASEQCSIRTIAIEALSLIAPLRGQRASDQSKLTKTDCSDALELFEVRIFSCPAKTNTSRHIKSRSTIKAKE